MKQLHVLCVSAMVYLSVLSGCTPSAVSGLNPDSSQGKIVPDHATANAQGGRCGDGSCDALEMESENCPRDCVPDPMVIDDVSVQQTNQPVVYLGLTVHLEGWFEEVETRDVFEKHMGAAQELSEIFERHGAFVTFEVSPETIAANAQWGNVLAELENRGHSIGVHADAGGNSNPGYNQQLFTTELTEMKKAAEELGWTIEHVSGICSDLDWVRAAVDAGYEFTTGGVGYCAMSMPVYLRPSEYKACSSPLECHGLMPLEMEDRIHPWKVSTAIGDWTEHDPEGELVILSSDGGIKNLHESSIDPQASYGDMAYTPEDIGIVVERVEEALDLAEPDEVNILYFSLSIGAADVDEMFYTRMFEALQPFVDRGELQYRTLNDMYHAYLESR